MPPRYRGLAGEYFERGLPPCRFDTDLKFPHLRLIRLLSYMEVASDKDTQVIFGCDDALGDGQSSSEGDQRLVTAFTEGFLGG